MTLEEAQFVVIWVAFPPYAWITTLYSLQEAQTDPSHIFSPNQLQFPVLHFISRGNTTNWFRAWSTRLHHIVHVSLCVLQKNHGSRQPSFSVVTQLWTCQKKRIFFLIFASSLGGKWSVEMRLDCFVGVAASITHRNSKRHSKGKQVAYLQAIYCVVRFPAKHNTDLVGTHKSFEVHMLLGPFHCRH